MSSFSSTVGANTTAKSRLWPSRKKGSKPDAAAPLPAASLSSAPVDRRVRESARARGSDEERERERERTG